MKFSICPVSRLTLNLIRGIGLSLFFFFPLFASATDYLDRDLCGDGIDNDNSMGLGWGASNTQHAAGDTICWGSTDKDNDGYEDSNDCDDTNRYIFDGQWTEIGCPSGQVRECSGKQFGTCRTFSSTDCEKTGSGVCYCVDSAAGSNSNDGILDASPACWADFGPISGSCSSGTCVTPVAGSVIYAKGTFTAGVNGRSELMYIATWNCTSTDRCIVKTWPGESAILSPADVSTPMADIIYARIGSYVDFEGLELTGGFGLGFRYEDTFNNSNATRLYIHDINGEGANNISGFYIQNGAHHITLSNSIIHSIAHSDGGPSAAAKIFASGSTYLRAHHNVVFDGEPGESMEGLNNKHGGGGLLGSTTLPGTDPVWENDHNYYWGLSSYWNPIASANSSFHHNIGYGTVTNQFVILDGGAGGPSWLKNVDIYNNTLIAPGGDFIGTVSIEDNANRKQTPADINIYDNVVKASGTLTEIVRFQPTADATTFNTWNPITTFSDNCYYATGDAALNSAFNWFSSGGAGGGLYNFANWVSTAAKDTSGSYNQDQIINSSLFSEATNCQDKGAFPIVAGDIGCGRDTNLDGVVDNLCPGTDTDNDGFTVAAGDCDDTDSGIRPGTTVEGVRAGCTEGYWRTCKVAGTGWGTCTNPAVTPWCPDSADTTTHSGAVALACYYFSPTGSDTTGDGSYTNPWKSPGILSDGYAGAGSTHTPIAGDAFIFKKGNHTERYTQADGDIYWTFIRNKNGTATNRIWFVADPAAGKNGVVVSTAGYRAYGASPSLSSAAILGEGLDYWVIQGLAFSNPSGYLGQIFLLSGATSTDNTQILDNYIHDVDGGFLGGSPSSDNIACITISEGGTGNIISYNNVGDCYNRYDSGTIASDNNVDVTMFDQVSPKVNYNDFINVVQHGQMFKEKHAIFSAGSKEFKHNMGKVALRGAQFAGSDWTIDHNLFLDYAGACYNFGDLGGKAFWGNNLLEYNTCISKAATNTWGFMTGDPQKAWDSDNTAATDACSGTGLTFGPITWRKNIGYDESSSYATGLGTWAFATYGPDPLYNDFVVGGKWLPSSNGYYNPNASAKFGLYESDNGNTTCSGRGNESENYTLAQAQAAGFETSTVVADPVFNAIDHPTTVSMASWGYLGDISTTTTTSTTSTTVAADTSFRNSLNKNSLFRRLFRR